MSTVVRDRRGGGKFSKGLWKVTARKALLLNKCLTMKNKEIEVLVFRASTLNCK